LTFTFVVRETEVLVKVTSHPPTQEEIGQLFENCPKIEFQELTLEFEVELPEKIYPRTPKRISKEKPNFPWEGLILEINKSGKTETEI